MNVSYRASLDVKVVCQNDQSVVMSVNDYICTTHPEPHTRDHPVLLAMRIRQIAELRFLQHCLSGIIPTPALWQASWQMEIERFSYQ